jgi:hypothetical protein
MLLKKRKPRDPAENFKDVEKSRIAVAGRIPDQLRFGVFLVVFVFIGAIRGLEGGILSNMLAKGKTYQSAVRESLYLTVHTCLRRFTARLERWQSG